MCCRCLSEPKPSPHAAHALARLGTAILHTLTSDEAVPNAVAAGGKQAMALATTVRRCGVVHAAACHLAPTPKLQAEALSYRCATLALPPALLPPLAVTALKTELPGAILGGMKSHTLSLRRAAIATQRMWSEVEAAQAGGAGAVPASAKAIAARDKQLSALFDLMDSESSEEALEEAKLLLLASLHGTAEVEPAFWLKTLRNVVLEIKKEKAQPDPSEAGGGDDEEDGEEGGGGWDQNASGLPSGDSTEDSEAARRAAKELEVEKEEAAKWKHVSPRWQTRLFAVECVRRLLAVLEHPAHFDLKLAHSSGGNGAGKDYLAEHMQELVSVAFTAATSPFEAIRPAGIATVLDVADKYASCDDPEYEGHILLELYSAQISAALRPCFTAEAEPSLTATGCAATARFLTAIGTSARGHEVDPTAVRKLLALLTKASGAADLKELAYPAYSEATATMVRAAALQASAQVWQACSASPAEFAEVTKQLAPSLAALRDGWLALLRDFAMLDTQPKNSRRFYRPHLYVPATARIAHSQLQGAWPAVLSAAIATARTAAWKVGREGAVSIRLEPPATPREDGSVEPQEIKTRPEAEDVQVRRSPRHPTLRCRSAPPAYPRPPAARGAPSPLPSPLLFTTLLSSPLLPSSPSVLRSSSSGSARTACTRTPRPAAKSRPRCTRRSSSACSRCSRCCRAPTRAPRAYRPCRSPRLPASSSCSAR